MDQINESVDILVQHRADDDHSNQVQMIKLPQLNFISTRPLYSIQQRDILSIREYFKDKNWLLLQTYTTMNTMYLCNKHEFEQKLSEYFIQTNAYTLIKECSEMNQDDLQKIFSRIVNQIDLKLYNLLHRRHITLIQYCRMLSSGKRDENQINSIIFLPDIRMVSLNLLYFFTIFIYDLLTYIYFFSTIGNSTISTNNVKCIGTSHLYFSIFT